MDRSIDLTVETTQTRPSSRVPLPPMTEPQDVPTPPHTHEAGETSGYADGCELTGTPVALQRVWCFWADRPLGKHATTMDLESHLHVISTVSTVQEFWHTMNNLPHVEKLRAKSCIHMMAKGVKPMWEDPLNVNGGFLAMRFKRSDIATVWRELVMAVVGEQFGVITGNSEEVSGVTVSQRNSDSVIQLWNRNAQLDSDLILERIKNLLPKGIEVRMPFYKACRDHADFSEDVQRALEQGEPMPDSPLSISPSPSHPRRSRGSRGSSPRSPRSPKSPQSFRFPPSPQLRPIGLSGDLPDSEGSTPP